MPSCSVNCPQSHVFSVRTGQDLARNSQMDGEGSFRRSLLPSLPHVLVLDFCLCKRTASLVICGPCVDRHRTRGGEWGEWGAKDDKVMDPSASESFPVEWVSDQATQEGRSLALCSSAARPIPALALPSSSNWPSLFIIQPNQNAWVLASSPS